VANPNYKAGDFLLQLDGHRAGRLLSAEGGGFSKHALEDPMVPKFDRRGNVSTVEIDPLVLYCGTGMSHAFYDWIASTFNRKGNLRMSGAIITFNKALQATFEQEFRDAIVTEVVLPDLDASKKDDAALKVKIKPENIRYKEANGKVNLGVYASRTTKAWHVNSFRLKIDDLPRDSQNVTKIRGIQVKQGFKSVYTSGDRHPMIEPTKLELPNLVIEVPPAHIDGYKKWHEASLKDSSKTIIRKGTLDYLGPEAGGSYFGLDLTGLGIVGISQRSGGQPAQIEMYCERMSFRAGPAAVK
jgi:hypothetical protein